MRKMATRDTFEAIGQKTDSIDVRLSYRIVELFSEGLYASPNKAIEELVANSFDAGARQVQVMLSANLHAQAATIVVIDDGEGMDASDLKQHWLIGISSKRSLKVLPRGRQQIGKFGIGKLATYVLASRLTHISKKAGRYFSTSIDFTTLDRRLDNDVEPVKPIRIPLRSLTELQAKQALKTWTDAAAFRASGMTLFGKNAEPSWTVAVMSSLKPKVHEIRPGLLEWILRTALPLRPDFGVWLNGTKLAPSKQGKGLLKRWTIGKDMTQLPKPAPKGISVAENTDVDASEEGRFGLEVPGLGRITGYAEAYRDLLTGKSDDLGRSYGFFIYVFGRLINVLDGHFGISPDELRHGTFGRFRLVIHMDGLDQELRSNRETVSEGPLLGVAQDVLRAVFNSVRPTLEKHDKDEEPGAKLSRRMAASPASLSRFPIVELARAVSEGKSKSRYLLVPVTATASEREAFLASLKERATHADSFVSGRVFDYDGSPDDGFVRFDTSNGVLRLNAWHPFVATFFDEFNATGVGQALELLAMAEVLGEAHLHAIGVGATQILSYLSLRDQLLRNLANESGRPSALAVANNLRNARNSPTGLEERVCAAFRSLGFDVTPLRKRGQPDGVAHAHLSAREGVGVRRYAVSLEAKSKAKPGAKVSAKSVGISTIARQRDAFHCDHAIVVGPAFPTSQGDTSALAKEIQADKRRTAAENRPRTITLITIDDLASLVRMRPIQSLGLAAIRELFLNCELPENSALWVESIRKLKVTKPPYRRIVKTIEELQKEYQQSSVTYPALRVKLFDGKPSIKYETDEQLIELCRGMAQMAPGAMYAGSTTVELDQSVENVIAAIDAATRDYPPDQQ